MACQHRELERRRRYILGARGPVGPHAAGAATEPSGDAGLRAAEPARVKVAFLLNDLQLSGGVGVVVQHARSAERLDGWDVTLVLVREDEEPSWHGYEHLRTCTCGPRARHAERYDIAVATWWETTFTLFELSADRYAYFVQSLEDRFYRHDQAERLGAALTLDLPVAFITEARWIVETLSALRPDAPCYLVRNGIDKQVFAPLDEVTSRSTPTARCGSSSRARRGLGSSRCPRRSGGGGDARASPRHRRVQRSRRARRGGRGRGRRPAQPP